MAYLIFYFLKWQQQEKRARRRRNKEVIRTVLANHSSIFKSLIHSKYNYAFSVSAFFTILILLLLSLSLSNFITNTSNAKLERKHKIIYVIQKKFCYCFEIISLIEIFLFFYYFKSIVFEWTSACFVVFQKVKKKFKI